MSKINDFEFALKQKKKWSKETRLKIAKKIKDLLEGSTSHGIPNIMRTTRVSIKILWTICFVAAVCVCSIMVFKSVNDYFDYETISKIEYITEIPTKFPTFSFCNINPFTTAESESFLLQILESIDYNKSIQYTDYNLEASNLSYAFYNGLISSFSPDYGDEKRKKLGYNLSSTLISCSFNGESCNETHFEWYYDLTYGNCYRFNSGRSSSGKALELKESVKPGPNYGLSMRFYLRPSNNKYSSAIFEGLKVFIHNSSIKPASSEGFSIESSKKTDIAIQRTFISKEPDPYSDCVDLNNYDSSYYRFLTDLNLKYRQQDCFNLCLQKQIIEKCSCYDLNFPMISNSTPCGYDKINCSYGVFYAFIKNKIDDECSKLCPLECDSIRYDVSISSNTAISRQGYNLYKKIIDAFAQKYGEYNLTYEEVKERLLILNIYYSELSYIRISESPKTSIIDLFSNLGGTLGLYVGISFLSFIEIVEIILEIIFISFNLNL